MPTDGGNDAPVIDVGAIDAGAVDGGVPDDAGAGDLMRDFCGPLAALVCGSAETCGCGAVVPGGVLDRAGCEAQWSARCLEAWQPFVSAGARIDPTRATACIDAIEAGTPACGRPDGTLPFAVCAPFAIEDAAIGEACMTPYCAGGMGVCAEGRCVARGEAGATCNDMFSCATGLVCGLSGTCTALRAAGGACIDDVECAPPLHCTVAGTCAELADEGGACADPIDCAVGLRCEGGTCTAGPSSCTTTDDCGNRAECGGPRVCSARLGAGSACSDDRDCEAALYCGEAGTCIARPTAGAPCARGTLCAAGLGCDTDGGTCIALPTTGACAFGEMGPICAEGFACIDGATCGALPTEGQPCASGNLCAAGLGCDFTAEGSFCIVPRGEGGACQSDRSCAEGFHCGPVGTCDADLPSGAPCEAGNECAGVCGPDAAGNLVCRDAPDAGDPCIFSDECPLALTCAAPTLSCVPEICREL